MTKQEQKAFDLMREALEQALRGISAAIFGTDTYKVSSRGDFVSKVEKQIREAITAANAVSEPQSIISRDADADHGVKLSVYGDHIHPSAAGRARVIDAYLALKNDSQT